MTVKQLIEKLSEFPPDLEVWVDSDRGDYEYTGRYLEERDLVENHGEWSVAYKPRAGLPTKRVVTL